MQHMETFEAHVDCLQWRRDLPHCAVHDDVCSRWQLQAAYHYHHRLQSDAEASQFFSTSLQRLHHFAGMLKHKYKSVNGPEM